MKNKPNTVVIIAIFLVLSGLGISLYLMNQEEPVDNTITDTVADNIEDEVAEDVIEEPKVVEPEYYEFSTVEDQTTFIYWPSTEDIDTTLKIVVFSHGSNTTVTESLDNTNVQDMIYYGENFVADGYIFVASNMYGANWGSQASIDIITSLFEYIEANSPYEGIETVEKYVIGYSMGGLAAERWMFDHGEELTKMALLAPTLYYEDWSDESYAIAERTTKIWHGDNDVNVPWYTTNTLRSMAEDAGYIIQYETVDGASHFDLDTELVPDIIEYFNAE